jgi:hypothetical protein
LFRLSILGPVTLHVIVNMSHVMSCYREVPLTVPGPTEQAGVLQTTMFSEWTSAPVNLRLSYIPRCLLNERLLQSIYACPTDHNVFWMNVCSSQFTPVLQTTVSSEWTSAPVNLRLSYRPRCLLNERLLQSSSHLAISVHLYLVKFNVCSQALLCSFLGCLFLNLLDSFTNYYWTPGPLR